MNDRYVLDTHTLLWYFGGSPKLPLPVRDALKKMDQSECEGYVSVVTLAEIFYLKTKNKIAPSFREILNAINSHPSISISPLDLDQILAMEDLDGIPEMHDKLITALAKTLNAALLTKDSVIRESKKIPVIWD